MFYFFVKILHLRNSICSVISKNQDQFKNTIIPLPILTTPLFHKTEHYTNKSSFANFALNIQFQPTVQLREWNKELILWNMRRLSSLAFHWIIKRETWICQHLYSSMEKDKAVLHYSRTCRMTYQIDYPQTSILDWCTDHPQ